MNYETLWRSLTNSYETGEAKAIARFVMETRLGLTLTDILCGKDGQLSAEQQAELQQLLQRLLKGEPVQYVAGVADFGPRQFAVEPGVLIPRPETYELCEWIMERSAPERKELKVLDIGTGSGCIACTLAAEMNEAKVWAWDISEKALDVASSNARRTHVRVVFQRQDALHLPEDKACWDVIVSNPPYVCEQEKEAMERNVLEHEPPLALFVPDDEPLLFYRSIARYAAKSLKTDGKLYFEINPLYASDMEQMLNEEGYNHVETRKDMFNKQRFICTWL